MERCQNCGYEIQAETEHKETAMGTCDVYRLQEDQMHPGQKTRFKSGWTRRRQLEKDAKLHQGAETE